MVQNMVLPNTWTACLGMFYIVIYYITFLAKLTLSVTQKQHSTAYKMQKQVPLVQKPSCPQGDKP